MKHTIEQEPEKVVGLGRVLQIIVALSILLSGTIAILLFSFRLDTWGFLIGLFSILTGIVYCLGEAAGVFDVTPDEAKK